jgi:hypothetical protein
MPDENMKRFCTDRQWEVLCAVEEHGGQRAAAKVLGTHHSLVGRVIRAVAAKAAKQGYAPEYDYTRQVPDGFKLKGVSTYYGADGEPRGQWVKSATDNERQLELMREAIEALTSEIVPLEPRIAQSCVSADNLMACYPVGDYHLGMMSWAKETGGDWDMKIAEGMMNAAITHLTDSMPLSQYGLVAILGDFFHYDNMEAVTPTARNILDSDTRYPKMVRAGIRIARMMIEKALDRHAIVRVIVEIGNHDLSSSIFLMEALRTLYENEPRVSVDTSPAHYHYYRFGSTLIGTHHGHGAKMAQLPMIMAQDRPEDWGATKHRYWWTGHIHTSKTQHMAVGAQDFVACSVESFRIIAPEDAWAAQKGYRSIRDMTSILIHKDHGEVARFKFNPAMMEK